MEFFNTSVSTQQRLAVLVPVIALILSIFVVYPKWQNYQALLPRLDQQRRDLTALKAAGALPDMPNVAAVPALPSEPPAFMGELGAIAAASNCRINGFDLKTGSEAVSTGPMQPVSAEVRLVARYASIRDFVIRIANAKRIFVITDIKIAPIARTPNDGLFTAALQATLQIERYVVPPDKR